MWINIFFTIFFTLQFINMILITYVTQLPFPYTPSPPPYLFPDLSLFLCLKCTMYIVFVCNSHSFSVGQSIKTTYYSQAGPNYILNCDFLFVLSRALQLNKNMKYELNYSCSIYLRMTFHYFISFIESCLIRQIYHWLVYVVLRGVYI